MKLTENLPGPALKSLPRGVIILGFVSMLMDISSEMIHGLLPVYLAVGLGASMLTIGIIEGVADATSAIVKIFSGVVSDYIRKRKLLVGIGYGMAALTKPIFPLASVIEWIIAARFIDRIGKGIRGAPRDALIADITPPAQHGAAYGLRQSMDTVGAFAGPLLAITLMALSGNDFALVFWIAVIPAFAAFALVLFGVREPPARVVDTGKPEARVNWREWRSFKGAYWAVVLIGSALTLARFSEAFLILRAQELGLVLALAPLVLVVMNIVYSASAYPAGRFSDGRNRLHLIAAGLVALIIGDLLMANSDNLLMLALGIILWGLHMGLTQGLLSALVADTTPEHLRGTGFGLFNLITGIMMLAASVIAGILWQGFGASVTFYAGAAFAALSLLGIMLLRGVKT
ncbi:MAG TPA: MFS transporter [Alphaproteobacteria bacterium]|nr:MFS transporter [Alphaproteobacteria bacterium]